MPKSNQTPSFNVANDAFDVTNDANVRRERETKTFVQKEITALERQLAQAAEPSGQQSLATAVDSVLSGKNVAPAVPDREELRQRLRVLRAAYEEQCKRVAAAESEASREIAIAAKPEYVAILKRGVDAAAALRQFILDERDFREALVIQGDVRLGGVITPLPLIGTVQAGNTDLLDSFLADAKAHYGLSA